MKINYLLIYVVVWNVKNFRFLWYTCKYIKSGLIIGAKGSSYPILKRLVERLPGMVLPSWAYNMIAPVSINDVINKLALLVERTPQHNESFDITGPEIMNYKELIQRSSSAK